MSLPIQQSSAVGTKSACRTHECKMAEHTHASIALLVVWQQDLPPLTGEVEPLVPSPFSKCHPEWSQSLHF